MDQTEAPSILVVDDTVENLRLLTEMLGEQQYEVRPVTSGRLALQAAAHDPPDLILLDITMPEMDGYDVCKLLKAEAALQDVPVIFLTALSETADKIKAFEAGGVDYITKPFQIDEVLARVKTHIALRRARLELLQNYERLRQLEQLRADLVQMVVHDMRSPLTVLLGHLELLKDEVANALGPAAVEDLRAAIQGATVVNRMANDLLDVSRLEEGKMPMVRTRLDLTRIARDVCEALKGWDRSRTIEVQESGPIDVDCDGGMVHRVVENLVSNAIKHTPAGGRIRISVGRVGGRARVAVADEGPGIPPEARETIFEKFGTVATRKERTYHSVGLGLSFCKLAVEAHGGLIGVDARGGGGSVFRFDLPVS